MVRTYFRVSSDQESDAAQSYHFWLDGACIYITWAIGERILEISEKKIDSNLNIYLY